MRSFGYFFNADINLLLSLGVVFPDSVRIDDLSFARGPDRDLAPRSAERRRPLDRIVRCCGKESPIARASSAIRPLAQIVRLPCVSRMLLRVVIASLYLAFVFQQSDFVIANLKIVRLQLFALSSFCGQAKFFCSR